MNYAQYPLAAEKTLMVFEFLSEGPKGKIRKIIKFEKTSKDKVYNLGFGDLNETTGEVDDKVVTDNGDMEKVLATVVGAVYAFTDKYPKYWVYAVGSTAARTRRYQMGISRFLTDVKRDFEVYGLKEGAWEPFRVGVNYEGFLAKRKKQ